MNPYCPPKTKCSECKQEKDTVTGYPAMCFECWSKITGYTKEPWE